LVGYIPKTRKSIREEQDNEGLSFDCQREIFQLLPHGSLARDENSRAIIPENGFGFGDKECNDTAHQHQDEKIDIRPIIRGPSCGDAPILRGRNDSSNDGDEERQSIENRNVFPLSFSKGKDMIMAPSADQRKATATPQAAPPNYTNPLFVVWL